MVESKSRKVKVGTVLRGIESDAGVGVHEAAQTAIIRSGDLSLTQRDREIWKKLVEKRIALALTIDATEDTRGNNLRASIMSE